MAVPSSAQIARLRRLVAEPTPNTYTDIDLSAALELWPLPDADGLEPDSVVWAGAWDINQAAADIWEEKAATVAGNFDFAADGGDYKRSQAYTQATTQARSFRARRQTGSLVLIMEPKPLGATRVDEWIGNLPEEDDDL
jgi:hypothetical protein